MTVEGLLFAFFSSGRGGNAHVSWGGIIKFDMQDGTCEELEIIELKLHSILEYTWGEDRVRFELYLESDGW